MKGLDKVPANHVRNLVSVNRFQLTLVSLDSLTFHGFISGLLAG